MHGAKWVLFNSKVFFASIATRCQLYFVNCSVCAEYANCTQSNNAERPYPTRRMRIFVCCLFFFSLSTRTKCQAINYTPLHPCDALFFSSSFHSRPLYFLCLLLCSNGRSWKERSLPWWCHRRLYIESSAAVDMGGFELCNTQTEK